MIRDLTTQQKSRLRRAYREAFDASDRMKAVAALYEKFTELYGLTVDEIWDFLSPERPKEEESEQPRNVVSTKRPTEGDLPPIPESPQQQLGLTKKQRKETVWLVCESCGHRVAGRYSGVVVRHKFEGRRCPGIVGRVDDDDDENPASVHTQSRRETGTCRVCKKKFRRRQTDGRMVSHTVLNGQRCKGSGRTPREGRDVKDMNFGPIRVVRGGLPGLGHRR
jgi:hypothetical protein